MFVLDCSVTMAWLFEDEKTKYTEKVLDSLGDGSEALVPSLWVLEVTNVLLVAERQGRLSQMESVQFLETLKSLLIQVEEIMNLENGNSILFSSRTYGLSACDAAYLDLAIHRGLLLASLDRKLVKAAKKTGIDIV